MNAEELLQEIAERLCQVEEDAPQEELNAAINQTVKMIEAYKYPHLAD